jgi:hypothetical protein
MEKRKSYKILVGRPEGKRPFERSKRKWRIIIKHILKKQRGRVWTARVEFL